MAAPQLPFQFASAADAVHPALGDFHPLVQRWFRSTLGEPSEPQSRGWPRIQAGEDVLIAAPTGSGKTLVGVPGRARPAAAARAGEPPRGPDVGRLRLAAQGARQRRAEEPARAARGQLRARGAREGLSPEPIRVQVRTGDTPASERRADGPPAAAHPHHHARVALPVPHRRSGRARRCGTCETVIVDEIHALARDKRGCHLALSLERLKALARPASAADRPLGDPEAAGAVRVVPHRRAPGGMRRWCRSATCGRGS